MNTACRLTLQLLMMGAMSSSVMLSACAPPPINNTNANATPTKSVVAQSPTEATQSSTQKLPAEDNKFQSGLRFETATAEKQQTKRKFSIKVKYPQLAGGDASGRGFNEAIQQLVEQILNEFFPDKRDRKKERSGCADVEEEAWINYEISYVSDEIISIVFSVYYDDWSCGCVTGYPLVFNYDLRRNKELEPHDLFKPRSDYARTLISYCEPVLRERYYSSFKGYSFAEKVKEYTNLSITEQGLNVIFGEYAFGAPGGASIHSVLVPYDVIQDKLNPRSPIASLANVAAANN